MIKNAHKGIYQWDCSLVRHHMISLWNSCFIVSIRYYHFPQMSSLLFLVNINLYDEDPFSEYHHDITKLNMFPTVMGYLTLNWNLTVYKYDLVMFAGLSAYIYLVSSFISPSIVMTAMNTFCCTINGRVTYKSTTCHMPAVPRQLDSPPLISWTRFAICNFTVASCWLWHSTA